MIAQDDGRCANTDLPCLPPLQIDGDGIQVAEEGLNKTIEFLSCGCQRKGAPLKQDHSEEFFELRHLPADSRLLDSVGNIAHGFCDATVSSHVIKQLEVMNVHAQ